MDSKSKEIILDHYHTKLSTHGSAPEAMAWSAHGQLFRFQKIAEIADLRGAKVLDVGCGLGDLYAYLREKFGDIDYTGADIASDMIEKAKQLHPGAKFECRDITENNFSTPFDYVLLSGVFNTPRIPARDRMIRETLTASWAVTRKALGFNFISNHVTRVEGNMDYHDPKEILDFCIRELSIKVNMFHCYERRDVAMFVYRE